MIQIDKCSSVENFEAVCGDLSKGPAFPGFGSLEKVAEYVAEFFKINKEFLSKVNSKVPSGVISSLHNRLTQKSDAGSLLAANRLNSVQESLPSLLEEGRKTTALAYLLRDTESHDLEILCKNNKTVTA